MSSKTVTIRMGLSSWQQICDDLGNFWGMSPDETEVFESVEILAITEDEEDL